MKIRIAYTVDLDDDALAAYRRYHGEALSDHRGLRESIRVAYEQNGKMGVEEQLHEGAQWLGADAEHDDDDGGADV